MFVVPNFNLVCDVWTWPAQSLFPALPVGPPRLAGVPCALVYGQRTNVASTGGTGIVGVPLQQMSLLLPVGTDIRGPQDSVGPDAVECPPGSGRFYAVTFVDDIGKGYGNEHRTATLFAGAGMWVAPYP